MVRHLRPTRARLEAKTLSTAHRPVSGLERVWLAAEGIDPPFTIRVILRPARMPDAARWQAAWAALIAVRPGLRLRAVGRLRTTRWIADAAAPVEVLDDDWDGWTDHPAVHVPLDPWAGPTTRLVVMNQVAMLVVHHAIVDGRGGWRIASDLLAILDGAAPRAAALAPLDADVVRTLALPEHVDPKPDRRTPFGPATQSPGFVWARRRLAPQSQLLARLAVGLVGVRGEPLRVGVPVDLRRHLAEDEAGGAGDGNLTGVAHIELDPAMDAIGAQAAIQAAVDARQAEAHALAADALRGYPLWLMRWAGRHAAQRQRDTRLSPVSATLSNLGRLPLTLAGAPVEVCFMPPYNRGMPLLITLVGDSNAAQLVAVAPAALGDAGRLDEVLDQMCDGLTA